MLSSFKEKLNFENQTIIKRATGIFVKQHFCQERSWSIKTRKGDKDWIVPLVLNNWAPISWASSIMSVYDEATPYVAIKVYSGRTLGAKKSDQGAHFDRREPAQVNSKSSLFFLSRSAGAQRGKVSASSTWVGLPISKPLLFWQTLLCSVQLTRLIMASDG